MKQTKHSFIRTFLYCSLLICSIGFFSACQKSAKNPEPSTTAPSGSKTVHLAIWSNYLSQDVLDAFEKKTGMHVSVTNYSSNEELLAKLQAGATGYDVAVPSDYMVGVMRKLGLLEPLDRAKISSFSKLSPFLLKRSFDPENQVSVPYGWGTTGIGIRRDLYKGEIKGWKDLFEKPDLAGKFTLLDDVREVMGAALKRNGLSLNSHTDAELEKAKKVLMATRSRVKAFTSEPLPQLVSGDLAVAHIYSVDALQARKQSGGKVDFILPEEGGTFWIDTLAIPKGAPNKEGAHLLIDYLTQAQVVSQVISLRFMGPISDEAKKLLTPELQNDFRLIPTEKQLAKFEMIEDLGAGSQIWDRIWTEIKAAQ